MGYGISHTNDFLSGGGTLLGKHNNGMMEVLGNGGLNNGGFKFRLVAGNSIVVVTGTYLVYSV